MSCFTLVRVSVNWLECQVQTSSTWWQIELHREAEVYRACHLIRTLTLNWKVGCLPRLTQSAKQNIHDFAIWTRIILRRALKSISCITLRLHPIMIPRTITKTNNYVMSSPNRSCVGFISSYYFDMFMVNLEMWHVALFQSGNALFYYLRFGFGVFVQV
jgi:hypothetical protein